jgi:DNA-binding response OmpR family regulator
MARKKILVADDDPDITRLLKGLLEEEGYEVIMANDGQKALDFYRSERPGLLILDVIMPGKDGLTLCEEIRREDSSVLILMLTGQRTVDTKVTGLSSGADGYLTKPFGARELIARVKSLFRRLNH